MNTVVRSLYLLRCKLLQLPRLLQILPHSQRVVDIEDVLSGEDLWQGLELEIDVHHIGDIREEDSDVFRETSREHRHEGDECIVGGYAETGNCSIGEDEHTVDHGDVVSNRLRDALFVHFVLS